MKTFTSFAFILALAFAFSSCKKEGVTITKVINVDLAENESYKTAVPPAGDADDVMQITSQPQHSSACTVAPDAGTGSIMLQYTPSLNYIGTDEVQVSNTEGQHHGGGHHGNCSGHHHDNTTVYIYKINITGNTK